MKKFLTLVVALAMVVPMMAIGRNDGSTKANAIDFDWNKGLEHEGGTKWYRVDLAPLYEEENPSLALYLTNPSNAVGTSVDVSMQATVAGQSESSSYTIYARQYKTYTANASMLVRMKQTEIYLTLTTNGRIKLSAKVFEAADLDETCQDARTLNWEITATQTPSYSAWWKVSLTPIKEATDKDAKITITNTGNKDVTLKVGQSLDCPSSGVTKRNYLLAPGEAIVDTVPRSMIANVQPDELYFGIENVESTVSILVEKVNQPEYPIIPASEPYTELHVTDTIESLPTGTTLYRIKVADMDSLAKYEPEFTYRNTGTTTAKVTVKMAFEVPAFGTSNSEYTLAPGTEEIVVYKKNMLEGMEDVEYIYLLTTVEGSDVNFYGRFKHVREGKACKTNIDFNWESGHSQEGRTTQWYAVDVADARDNVEDIEVHVLNLADASATLKASIAFSCPYIDLQEISRTIGAGKEVTRTLGYSSYAMMSDTVWIGLETNQNIRFWVTTKPAETKEPDEACLTAVLFDWEEGVVQHAGDTVWYKIAMDDARDQSAKFPTVFVQNLSSTNAAKIKGELSLECPDDIANETRSMTIAANGTYSKQLSRNLFENIVQDTIYLRVITTQDISLQIRLTEEEEGSSCSSAIPFNWVSGNTQSANANLWYAVDLRNVMQRGNDIRLHIENKENAVCKGVAQLLYECPSTQAPSIQDFTLAKYGTRSITVQNSALEMVEDSMVYVNVQGTTALRFWADTLPVKHFDTIYAEGLTLIPLQWDSLYTQDVDTAWYIIPKSEIDKVRNLDEKVKPVAHLINLTGSKMNIKGEAAFSFPISKKMMTKTQSLKANQHYTDTIPAGTFDQFLKKDSVILRVTRPAGAGAFQFRAELVSAFNGNSRYDALPILLDKMYTQSPNTEMWYKLNTADLKKDKNLFNKALNVMTKNAGTGSTKVKVSVYDGLLSEVDLFEEYGLEKYRERTIPKGKRYSHNMPAQAVYGLGDVEMYIKIRTTDSLVFETKFAGTYAPMTSDPKQKEAKLVVPNVDYIIPGDNQEHWYMICMPYFQNNYIYTDTSSLTYEVTGKVTIEGTATFQDEMDCKMPVRKRTFNKNGGTHKGKKLLSELFNKAVKKAGYTFDISSFQPQFIDSLLHRFVTNDSITLYVRVKSDKEIKARLNTPQITGDECTNPMTFDWEHGNVNPAGATTWYHVKLDSIIIPDTCDLRLHVANWGVDSTETTADIYFDCNDPKTKGGTYKIGEGMQDSIDIDRDFLAQLGWADMIINYNSDNTTHIWAELIPSAPRDTLRDTIVAYVCQGESYIDTITHITYGPIDHSIEWYDTVTFKDGVVMKDSITLFQVHPMVAPEALTVDSMKKLNAAPVLVQGMQLFVDSSSVQLTKYYQNLGNSVDTIIKVDTVYWAKPVWSGGALDPDQEAALDLTTYYQKNDTLDTLLLVIKGLECGVTYRKDIVFPLEEWKYAPKSEFVCPPLPAKNPDTLSYATTVPEPLYYNRPRYVDTIVTYVAMDRPMLFDQSELEYLPTVGMDGVVDTTFIISYLKALFDSEDDDKTMDVTFIEWEAQDATGWHKMPYTVTLQATASTLNMRYLIDTECGVKDTSATIVIDVPAEPVPPCKNDTTYDPAYASTLGIVMACDSFQWALKDTMIYTNGIYYYNDGPIALGSSCDQIYFVNVTINQSTDMTQEDSVVCAAELPITWHGKTITSAGMYYDTLHYATTGCDSVRFTLNLTVQTATDVALDSVVCEADIPIVWGGQTITAAGLYYDTLHYAKTGCDSVHLTLDLKVQMATDAVKEDSIVCEADMPITWRGHNITSAGLHYDTLRYAKTGCDSVRYTLDLTVYKTDSTIETLTKPYCNMYVWEAADTIITKTGSYYHTFTGIYGCDSVARLDVTINVPYVDTLEVKAYYGYRIIMINRNQINDIPGWQLDSLDTEHPEYVSWYQMLGATPDVKTDKKVGEGYYYTMPDGEPLPAGNRYYAVVDIPASDAATCGAKGVTNVITIGTSAAAPALVPSLSRPGEDIQVINLNPTEQTTIRIYSTDGLLQRTYTAYGEESFTIKAANDFGVYLVELSNDNLKSTLRYIVK